METLDAIVISDLHLGSINCNAKGLIAFLSSILHGELKTKALLINGDVFDSYDFRRLKKTHWKVLSIIRHLSDKIDIHWIYGNHDVSAEIVSHLIGVEVSETFIIQSGNKKIFFSHGHIYDKFLDEHPVITWIGDTIYNFLQKIDRSHVVAKLAKSKSKTFLRCAEKVRNEALEDAQKHGCTVACCGHTHHPEEYKNGLLEYYNSGCWTENPATYLSIKNGHVKLHKV